MSAILRIYSDRGHDDAKGKDHGAVNNGLIEGNMNQITGAAIDNRFLQHGYIV